VSASIPVAVISLAMFRGLSKVGLRDSTILENKHHADRGFGGRVDRVRRRRDDAGSDSRLRSQLTRVMLVAVMGGACWEF